MRINYIAPLSAAKVMLVLYGVLGLVFGLLFAAISLFGAAAGVGDESALMGMIFGVGAIVAMPIFYGGLGAVTALFMAWLYNVTAGLVGGIEIRVDGSPTA